MKTLLMHPDRDFDERRPPPWNERALGQDLALEILLEAMAGGDQAVYEVVRRALPQGQESDRETVRHRQAIARDVLANPAALRELYALAVEAVECKRQSYFGVLRRFPSSTLYGAIQLMRAYVPRLRRLRELARAHAPRFSSEGFKNLFGMLERELSDAYLAAIESHLVALKLRHAVLVSARLGPSFAGQDYVLHVQQSDPRSWLDRLLGRGRRGFTFRLAERDEAGARALSELRDHGIQRAAAALVQATDHVDAFFHTLRTELAFYVGCLNLHERLASLGEPTCFPAVVPAGSRRLRFDGLYDPCLALEMGRAVVGDAADADGRSIVVISGANQGGKTTFLRAVGLVQLMLGCGTFVCAEGFEGELTEGLITHFKREEDPHSGKLDEELRRFSEIADHLRPHAMVLFNESFAATNEREGSEIARQVVTALEERRVRVLFVTHLHSFASGLFVRGAEGALFLRAERLPDGTRTFCFLPADPLATGHARDLYERIFGGS